MDGDINYREQVGFYTVKPNAMKNKIITSTADYNFFISCEAKVKMEEEGITNISFIPVYSKCEQNIVAYQIESVTLLKALNDFNATNEMFTELGSRYYIVSKKMYNILMELGAKKLKCEPISFIDV